MWAVAILAQIYERVEGDMAKQAKQEEVTLESTILASLKAQGQTISRSVVRRVEAQVKARAAQPAQPQTKDENA